MNLEDHYHQKYSTLLIHVCAAFRSELFLMYSALYVYCAQL